MTQKTFLMMAGGTGGHVFPALAIAQALREQGHRVEWLGTLQGIEVKLVPTAGFVLHRLNIRGVRGRGLLNSLLAPYFILRAIWSVYRLLRRLKPHAVMGLGGYVTGPGGVAAVLSGIPLVIHEQNAIAGTTNKLLAKIAQRVLTAFPHVLPNATCIGNPIRPDILQLPPPSLRLKPQRQPMRVLVLGGSLGASALNQLLPKAIAKIPVDDRPDIWHQAGEAHAQHTELAYRELQVAVNLEAFIRDMASAIGWADLVICRAGALTVCELSAAGAASLLVPYPFAIDDHQTANAQWLANAGAALVRQQAELSPEWLARTLMDFSQNREKLLHMAEAARTLAHTHATDLAVAALLELAHD